MTLAAFTPTKEGLLAGEIDLDTATIKIAAIRGYAFNAAHKFVSDVTGAGGTLVSSVTLNSNKTVAGGVFDNDDITFPLVPSGAAITALLYYQASAVGGGADVAASAQRLIMYDNQANNLPITPNGGNLDVTFSGSATRILALG